MVQKYTSKQGGRFYCLYVDFTKAFDKINHRVLFSALEKKNTHGKFLRVLTDSFSCNKGTRQGDKTSSTIFAFFIDELSALLRQTCTSAVCELVYKPEARVK